MNLDVNLWQTGMVLLVFLLIGLFIGSLKLGAKFKERQQARHERQLEKRRSQIAIAAGVVSQARQAQVNAVKPAVKKSPR